MSDHPLIYTSKGNLPVASLAYEPKWEQGEDFIKFSETWTLDGEIVKQNAHIYKLTGFFSEAVAQSI
jgi:hypothetical protein